MEASGMEKPQVTLIVGPRERFSYTRESLESIYRDTEYPFELVYVDVCTSPLIRHYLEEQAQQRQFTLIRTDYYISPNQARNVGLRHVLHHGKSKYVVFIENDVVVKRGWLTKLVRCAEETGAAVVGPLTCIGKPEHQVIHNAGGQSAIITEVKNGQTRRRIRQSAYLTGRAVADVSDQLRRTQCDFVEFHCMLARTKVFEETGLLDEGMLATREHIDFCFIVSQTGGSIYSEREAVITTDTLGVATNQKGLIDMFGYLQIPDFQWSDLPYFMLRWSDAWDLASLHHLRDKWDLAEDKYFKKRYAGIGSRRYEVLIRPLVHRLTFGRGSPWLEKVLINLERRLNHYLYHRYVQKKSRLLSQEQAVEKSPANLKTPATTEQV